MNNLGISDDKLQNLLNIAGKKLGQDPEELKSQLESGNLDSVISKLDPKSKEQMNSLIKDPKQVEALLANDKIKNLINTFMGKGK